MQVADRACEQRDQARATRRERVEVSLEVAGQSGDEDAWVLRPDRLRCGTQELLTRIERNEALDRARERVEQQAGVARVAGSELAAISKAYVDRISRSRPGR